VITIGQWRALFEGLPTERLCLFQCQIKYIARTATMPGPRRAWDRKVRTLPNANQEEGCLVGRSIEGLKGDEILNLEYPQWLTGRQTEVSES
jgi:hypothetical protein